MGILRDMKIKETHPFIDLALYTGFKRGPGVVNKIEQLRVEMQGNLVRFRGLIGHSAPAFRQPYSCSISRSATLGASCGYPAYSWAGYISRVEFPSCAAVCIAWVCSS